MLASTEFTEPRAAAMSTKTFTPQDLNTGFVVAINIQARDGEGDAVADILQRLIAPTMAEPGVKLFLPYRSPTDPNSFFIFELYRDEKAWAEHQATEHFKRLIPDLLPRVDKRERVPFVPFIPS
jgi:quinol monooxygenase YgiN